MTWKEFIEMVEAQGVTEETEINYIDVRSPDVTVERFEDETVSIFNGVRK